MNALLKLWALPIVLLFSFSSYSYAEEILVDQSKTQSVIAADGWFNHLNLSLGITSGSQKDVVGSTDGFTSSQTLKTDVKSYFKQGDSEWRNDLMLNLSRSTTPLLPRYVKSADSLSLNSIYLFHIPSAPQIGPYAELEAKTQALPSEEVRASEVTFIKLDENGLVKSTSANETKMKTQDAFKPITLKETLGMFYFPYASDALKVESQLGLGGRQTIAKGQYTLADVPETSEIELAPMKDQKELGSEAKLVLSGSGDEGRLVYKLQSSVFIPMQRDNESQLDKDLSGWEKRSWDLLASLTVKTYSWLAMEYQYELKRNYSLSPKIQRNSTFMLTASTSVGNEPPKSN